MSYHVSAANLVRTEKKSVDFDALDYLLCWAKVWGSSNLCKLISANYSVRKSYIIRQKPEQKVHKVSPEAS
jgi:hypothetical protein